MNRSDHLERTNLSTRACSLAPRERLQARSLRERKLLRSADLIVGLGYDTIEVEYEAWIDDRPLLQIDIEPADVAPTVKLVHQVTGDLASSLARPADQVRAGRQPSKGARAYHPGIVSAARRRGDRMKRREFFTLLGSVP